MEQRNLDENQVLVAGKARICKSLYYFSFAVSTVCNSISNMASCKY